MSAPATPTEPTFEQAMDRLDEIVSAMEGDRMPLDEMVVSYEEGMKLLQVCRARIETARRRVEQISSGNDGKAELTPFEPGTADTAEDKPKSAAPVRRRAGKAETGEASDEIRLF